MLISSFQIAANTPVPPFPGAEQQFNYPNYAGKTCCHVLAGWWSACGRNPKPGEGALEVACHEP